MRNSTRPQWLLVAIIVIGCALRWLAAVNYLDLIYPDQHFQTLEPASWVVFGHGWKSWEWYHGTRSWVVPALYMPLLWLFKLFGITSGPIPIQACQAYTASICVVMLWQFLRLLDWAGFEFWPKVFALGALSLSPTMIAWSGATFSDTWAMAVLWIVMPWVLDFLEKDNRTQWFWAGLLLGLTYMMRVQMAFWAVGLGLALLFWAASKRRLIPYLVLGYLVPVIFQGLLDWATWGGFLHSTIKNIQMNIFQGVANMNGVSPWYHYFFDLWHNLGPVLCIAITVTTLGAFAVSRAKIELRTRLVLFPAAVFLVAHFIIQHKENRFILPAYPALFFLMGWALNRAWRDRFPAFLTHQVEVISLAVIAVISALAWVNVHTSDHYSYGDLSVLSAQIHKDGALKSNPGSCLLFVDHFWIWTRGEMMLGMTVHFNEEQLNKIKPESLKDCVYAIMPGREAAEFEKIAGPHWQRWGEDYWQHVLYKKLL